MGSAGIELPEWINEATVERAYALEGGAEILHKMSTDQLGHNYSAAGIKMEATESQLWREAYKSADGGDPMVQFRWIYGAAAELAGITG